MPKIIICSVCGQERPYYAKDKCRRCYKREQRRNNPGKRTPCRECGKTRIHAGHGLCATCYSRWYKKDPKHKREHAERERRRRQENPEHVRKLDRQRNQTKKRKKWKRQYQRRYYLENREHLLEYQREYRKDTQRQTIYKARRRNRVNGLKATLTPDEWERILEEHNHSCFYCGATDCELEMEHKIPASRGGGLTADNIVPACGICNRRKDIKTVKEYYDYLVSLGEEPRFSPL